MSDFLAGSTALVTGASFGIGRSLSELLAPRVRHLVLTARSEEALAEVADTCRTVGTTVTVLPADLSRRDAPERLVAELARRGIAVDHLVNNAGSSTQSKRSAW